MIDDRRLDEEALEVARTTPLARKIVGSICDVLDRRDVELEALRKSVDELADENSELRLLCEAHGIEVPT